MWQLFRYFSSKHDQTKSAFPGLGLVQKMCRPGHQGLPNAWKGNHAARSERDRVENSRALFFVVRFPCASQSDCIILKFKPLESRRGVVPAAEPR